MKKKTHRFTLEVKTTRSRQDARLAVLCAFAGRDPDGCEFKLRKTEPKPEPDELPPPQTVGPGLTPMEHATLKHLSDAWNLFLPMNGDDDDSRDEFRRAINRAQDIIALRVARRVNPECWLQPQPPTP